MYSHNCISLHYETFLISNHNQHYITYLPISQNSNGPLHTQPMGNVLTQQYPILAKQDNAIWNLSKQLSKLSIKIANNKPKNPQPTEEGWTIWRHNCTCEGHLTNECPTPKRFILNVSCVKEVMIYMIVGIANNKGMSFKITNNQNCPWHQERNSPGSSVNYNPK